jgi:hypothetical protein
MPLTDCCVDCATIEHRVVESPSFSQFCVIVLALLECIVKLQLKFIELVTNPPLILLVFLENLIVKSGRELNRKHQFQAEGWKIPNFSRLSIIYGLSHKKSISENDSTCLVRVVWIPKFSGERGNCSSFSSDVLKVGFFVGSWKKVEWEMLKFFL